MLAEYVIPLPEVDAHGTPKTKMPNCPHCGEDELGMITEVRAVCYACRADAVKAKLPQEITFGLVGCKHCPWMGRNMALAEEASGKGFFCPQCLNLIVR